MSNRKEVTKFICDAIDKILPDGFNRKLTEDFLNKMTDSEFGEYMKSLGDESKTLSLIAPNGAKVKLELARNLQVAKEYNIPIWQRIWLRTPDGKGKYLSQDEYMIVRLPVRRQSQILTKKISIPKDNLTVDALTGQATGSSKGSKISYPEVQMLAAMGLNDTLLELIKYRGGDSKGFNFMNSSIASQGGVSLRSLETIPTEVQSTKSLSIYLTGMHLGNSL